MKKRTSTAANGGAGAGKFGLSPKHKKEGAAAASFRWDEDIDSESEDDEDNGRKKRVKRRSAKSKRAEQGEESSSSGSEDNEEFDTETAEQKRRRLAKEYLLSIQGGDSTVDEDGDGDEGGSIDGDDDRGTIRVGRGADKISESLRRERLEKQGKYFRIVGNNARSFSAADLTKLVHSDHNLSVTCVALSPDEKSVYSGAKDNSIVLWDLESNARRFLLPKWRRETHDNPSCQGEILSVAVTSDGRYLASGGRDMMVRIYDTRAAAAEVKAFQGHRDAVTSLSFRRDSYSLFSASLDRCLKHWDLNEMGYLETLFGHQDGVTAVDCWTKERPVSSSSDRTIRLWKISDETHLVFRGHKSTADSVQIMTDDGYLSGGQDGTLCLWKETQKKPIAFVPEAHGVDDVKNPRWICSIGSLKMSDFAASGSNDGKIRLWSVLEENRKILCVNSIPLEGFINSLAVSARLVVAGTGREHRLGRWWNLQGNKNKVVVFRLPESLDADSGELDAAYENIEDEEDDDEDEDEDENDH